MMRILVVEDEKLLCDGIAEDLELEKYTWWNGAMTARKPMTCF